MVGDPFFWASIGLFGWFLTPLVVGSRSVGEVPIAGYLCTALIVAGPIALPLPFVVQPRFELIVLHSLGAVLAPIGLVIALPTFFRVSPFTRPHGDEPLHRSGAYGLVRHPMMFGGALGFLGWSLWWGSPIGVGLAIVYGLCGWLSSYLEEERLVEEYGDAYRHYQREVPRFLPWPRPRRVD